MYVQLPLIPSDKSVSESLARDSFSHKGVCSQKARLALEERYTPILAETEEFNRKLVSYQGNKEAFAHSWLKYREGFSAQLVEILIQKFGIEPDDTLLDPFAGSATTLLVAKMSGINAIGIELLPLCHLAWETKSYIGAYDLDELQAIYTALLESHPDSVSDKFPHITITQSAFSAQTENDLMFYTAWFENLTASRPAKVLGKLLLTNILEEISYTRKDGQYLRWDYRAEKVQKRNKRRIAQGKKPVKKVDFGPLPTVKEALVRSFAAMLTDIRKLQKLTFVESRQELLSGNTLFELPVMEPDQFDGVITSPPYCNRYDYTRTYALEIAYLEPQRDIRTFRQEQLSCTVENRSKLEMLEQFYQSLGKEKRYHYILEAVQSNPAFVEINAALRHRWERDEMNNRGVLRMVEQYFTELAFVFAELWRVCRSGAYVAFVNDNVRYGGEIIPVDLLSLNLAESLGFEPVTVYVLPQRKGNSSQQMGRFGREPLRKSITVWRKP